jgi:hypothetical protein
MSFFTFLNEVSLFRFERHRRDYPAFVFSLNSGPRSISPPHFHSDGIEFEDGQEMISRACGRLRPLSVVRLDGDVASVDIEKML